MRNTSVRWVCRVCQMGRGSRVCRIAVAMSLAGGALGLDFDGPFPADLNGPALGYATRPEHNPVAELNARLQTGESRLKFEGTAGYLRSVLEALQVPVESQMVVFSKTSLQQRIISPTNPRTLFFNDSAAVGWVRGEEFVEVAVQDRQ